MAYKDLSETEKTISELEHLDTLDANTDGIEGKLGEIDNNTDGIESLISTTNSKLDTIIGKLDTIIANQGQ